jgi:hypothetical protein
MIIRQEGAFAALTSGFPIDIQLPDDIEAPENADFLVGVTNIHAQLVRPDGTPGSSQNLAIPADIIDVRGVVRWRPAGAPMDFTINGTYTIRLTLTFPDGNLTVNGDFKVND